MFERSFSGNNKIWGALPPNAPHGPVSTSTNIKSCFMHMLKNLLFPTLTVPAHPRSIQARQHCLYG